MACTSLEYCYLVTDGDINAVAGRALLRSICRLQPEAITTIVKGSRDEIRQNFRRLVHAYQPLLVLVDLAHDAACPPALLANWLGNTTIAERRCVRVAVRAIESWTLAEVAGIARALSISPGQVKSTWRNLGGPDELQRPKESLAGYLSTKSRLSEIRNGVVPRPGQRLGPLYDSFLRRFFSEVWQPERAMTLSPSLEPAVRCLRETFR